MALPLRFGVWALTHGAWASRHHPLDPPDASWGRVRRQILKLEELGYESTLLAQHIIHPSGDDQDLLENWTGAAALAALTSRIELIAAIKPLLVHPVVLAKMALQIENISEGRFGINLVNAWYRPELERSGIGFPAHDDRYAFGREWVEIVERLTSGQRVDFHGHHFNIDGYQLRPRDQFRPRPAIYLGGESEAARALAADAADVYFINGQPLEDVRALIQDVARRPRRGPPIRFGMSAFVVARETGVEADAELAQLFAISEQDKPTRARLVANADPDAQMFKTAAKEARVGTNGGTSARLVGSYDTVAQRILEFNAIGVELFMLQFQPVEENIERFAEHVIPRVRRLQARAA
ncbi:MULTISPECIES: LLM class flavin-dependent oxidoreductase [Bradyrhizobium]|jgi:alkanesulfonate monooxygenase|uniref:LLM class flavin-dependent oxidoreductase n=1 Tax=Bradyrhizobium TaxID=374 RepID=UPI0004863420|nr:MULTISPECIES: LLM class flavin-dependent oxidoreductase [Bradyrhizobium]MCS3451261.1 alkanesulfonate monooxygenase [Bradyrhizobium elkanii]MCS3566715.1 alkanesulfonate monooxygenase [Bradyrhizobium elkanii]MCW2152559.1 alkanesulfonate monooxygenase [Bradyrhizobium elkanii]MCW2357563.1 alkanesulfonate monooxygenase [Bradyrhizobium elkanii]MCW2376291.1 alkanesulfonate monooxygenase [Bradyrhizobium elkanii]